jgi:hypothetical protein
MLAEPNYNGSTAAIPLQPDASVAAKVTAALGALKPISLAEIDGVALLDRTDTKYIISTETLLELIAALTNDYRVLDIEGQRLNRYRTVYFDTNGMTFYLRHHAGNEVRHKVRSREYVDSHLSFLEVKRKTNKDRTVKERLQTPEPVTKLGPAVDDFLLSRFPLAEPGLTPKLRNEFSRATLVSNRGQERLTLDVHLSFAGNGREVLLPGVAIVEVKQAGFDRTSPVMAAMRSAGFPPRGISKYCLGVALLYPEIKHNNFKPKLLLLDKLMGGDRNV